jgi:hypothetical protein
MTKGDIVGYSVINILSLMSTVDIIDVMISWYDELSLISTVFCQHIMVVVKQLDDMQRLNVGRYERLSSGELVNEYQSSEEMAKLRYDDM